MMSLVNNLIDFDIQRIQLVACVSRRTSQLHTIKCIIWNSVDISASTKPIEHKMPPRVTTSPTQLLQLLNTVPQQDISGNKFTLQIPPNTDIFASPTTGYHFSAPVVYITLPLRDFCSAAATIAVPYTLSPSHQERVDDPTLQFDQGGLIFALLEKGRLTPTKEAPGGKSDHPRWIKAGIEVWEGKAWGSIVVREKWSDWSLFDVEKNSVPGAYRLRLQMEKLGDALMIFTQDENRARKIVRKVPWVFLESEVENVETVIVGVYGARPDPFDEAKGKSLEIEVENFEAWNMEGQLVG